MLIYQGLSGKCFVFQEEKRLKLQQEALELSQKRLQFLEKTKNLLNIGDVPTDETTKKPKPKKPKSYDLYSSGDEGPDDRGRSRKSGGYIDIPLILFPCDLLQFCVLN